MLRARMMCSPDSALDSAFGMETDQVGTTFDQPPFPSRSRSCDMVDPDRLEPTALERWGRRSWAFAGISLAAVAGYLGMSLISSLVVPLMVAVVVGALFAPLCEWLAHWIPRRLAAAVVLLGLLAVAVGAMLVAVRGLVSQAGVIGRELADGFEGLQAWLADLGIDPPGLGAATGDIPAWEISFASGLPAQLGTLFSGTTAFLAGLFVGIFLLYFILADWDTLTRWTSRRLGVGEDTGAGILEDSVWSMRKYFLALTISSGIVSIIVGVTAWLLGLPVAFAIGLVTFVTSYVPFLGAIVSGAFAVLIALGAGGLEAAAIMLVVILIAQNPVQTVIQTSLTRDALKLHPIVILGSTVIGAALFGLLGAALSTPLVAIIIKVVDRLRAVKEPGEGAAIGAPAS
jgi:putative heme transporter